eukprot:366428-Chlamydomonas_euryale.AAC.8
MPRRAHPDALHPTPPHPVPHTSTPCAGDLSYLRAQLRFIDLNPDLVRLRRSVGEPLLAWCPLGLSHPSRVYTTDVSLAGVDGVDGVDEMVCQCVKESQGKTMEEAGGVKGGRMQ